MRITLFCLFALCAQVFTKPINFTKLLARATELNKQTGESSRELSEILIKLDAEEKKKIKIWKILSDRFDDTLEDDETATATTEDDYYENFSQSWR